MAVDRQLWEQALLAFDRNLHTPGMFLTAQAGGKANTMTMGWGSLGYYWNKRIVTAPVRLTRYTRELIEESGCFTISIPKPGELVKELGVCGTRSGRDIDKFATCRFTPVPGRTVDVPVIGQAWLHLECKVLFKHDMTKMNLNVEVNDKFYADLNHHTLYMAEVSDFYVFE